MFTGSPELARIKIPVVMLHGLKDEIARPVYAKNIFDRIGSMHKKLIQYGNGFHELFNDTEGDKYKRDILSFMGEVLIKDAPPLGLVQLMKES
jgi:esterase/lipase